MVRPKLLCQWRFVGFALTIAGLSLLGRPARASVRRFRRAPLELNVFGPARPLTVTAWLIDRVGKNRRFDLSGEAELRLLQHYRDPARNRLPEWRSFWQGRYGKNDFRLLPKLTWRTTAPSDTDEAAIVAGDEDDARRLELRPPALDSSFDFSRAEVLPDWSLGVDAPEPDLLSVEQRMYCPRWKRPHAVSVVRFDGAEWARLPLVDCDGSIAPDALDRLSALARPPATPRPDLPLPLEPEQGSERGEWLPRVKLLHPRLIWLVSRIAEAFPNRSIFIMSGYRRDAHGSFHQQGRALDLYVTGIDNADLFRFCHTLNDVGCGYYPHNRFVHVDVRPFGTHRVAWVDVSEPGTASEYVNSWPGILSRPGELSAAGE